jgi:hypothetical protein
MILFYFFVCVMLCVNLSAHGVLRVDPSRKYISEFVNLWAQVLTNLFLSCQGTKFELVKCFE